MGNYGRNVSAQQSTSCIFVRELTALASTLANLDGLRLECCLLHLDRLKFQQITGAASRDHLSLWGCHSKNNILEIACHTRRSVNRDAIPSCSKIFGEIFTYMGRRNFSLPHNREMWGDGWSRKVNYVPNTQPPKNPEGSDSPVQVYESGPKKGERVTVPAVILEEVLYLRGSPIKKVSCELIAGFKKQFKRWLSDSENIAISNEIQAEIRERKKQAKDECLMSVPRIKKSMLKEIADEISNYWIRESVFLVRNGQEPMWITAMLDSSEDILLSEIGQIFFANDIPKNFDQLSIDDRNWIKQRVVQITSLTISSSKPNEDAFELIHKFHPTLRRIQKRP